MSWEEQVIELKIRQAFAKKMGGEKSIARQHAKGRLTIRERIALLLDSDSFHEIGSIAGLAEYDNDGNITSLTHSARIMGKGKINNRTVSIEGWDFTIRGAGFGGPGGSLAGPGGFSPIKMAMEKKIPFIRLLDSAGGSILMMEKKGYSSLPVNPTIWLDRAKVMAYVPVISAALGSLAGAPPVYAAFSHFSVMTKTSELFAAGPPLIKRAFSMDITKEELGNYKIHVFKSGVIDNLAVDEKDAFEQIKTFLGYLPQNVWEQPPCINTFDTPERRDEELISIIPKDRKKTYEIRKLIGHIVDKNSMFEIAPFYGSSLVTILARIDGFSVAIISNDCKQLGGAQTAAGCEKMTRFVDFADTFHIPIIYFIDNPGFMIGPQSETEGIERKVARLGAALAQITVPALAIIIRRCYGVAGAFHTLLSQMNLRYAWPSAEWGVLPIEGGVMAAYRREIENSLDPKAKLDEIESRFNKLRSIFRSAEGFDIEEIIDPRDTRPLLCEFVNEAQYITKTQLGPKYRLGMRP